MPVTFLNNQERKHYEQFPIIGETEMRQHFYLNQTDKIFLVSFNGELNRISVAVQLCLLRYLGYAPNNWNIEVDVAIIDFVAQQLYNKPQYKSLIDYGKWDKVRSNHLQRILKHLNFRKWQPLMDELIFEKWLVEQGMEHDNERYLLTILCEKLNRAKILRPAISTLETLVAGIREQLELETYQRLSNLLKEDSKKKLDDLLDVDASRRITTHRWLCTITMPTSNTAKEINFMFEKADFLIDMGVKTWDLTSLSDNRKKRLAHTVRTTNNTDLKRFKKTRLYPMLICFLAESFLDISDMILVMYADYWQQMSNKAKKALDMCLLEDAKAQQKAIKIVTQTSQIVVDESIEDPQLRPKIYEKVPKMQIQDALQMLTEKQQKTYSHLAFLKYSYPTMKQFTPNLLAKFDFKVAFTKDNFDLALTLVKDLQNGSPSAGKKRKIPQDAPMNFVSANWQKVILQGGIIHQQNYELCVLSLLKDRLQSGDVYINLSRKFANLESLLLEKNY